MASIVDTPWKRVRTPVEIPERVTARDLLDLGDVEFSELIRSNLYPRGDGAGPRGQWERLWRVLRGNDDLADRTMDVIEAWLEATRADVRAGLSPAELARVEKFRGSCEQAWDRVDIDTRSPLAWAGSANRFPPHAQRVINQLVQAIHRHRTTVGVDAGSDADQQLWQILRRVNLDPGDYR